MPVDLKRDWPVIAAGVAVVGGVIVYSMAGKVQGQKAVVLGGGGGAGDYAAAVQGQVALSQSRQQAYVQLATALVGGAVQHEQIQATIAASELQASTSRAALAAHTEEIRLQANAQLAAVQAQAHAQQQASTFGFLSSIVPFIFGLFCEESTSRAEESRAARTVRFKQAYPAIAA